MKMPAWMVWLLVASLLATVGMFALWQMSERGWSDALALATRTEDGKPQSEVDARRHAMLDEVIGTLEKYYDGPVDRTELVNGALKGAAAAVGDRYTELQVPTVASRHREQVEGKFAGIGVVINHRGDGTLEVTLVRTDSPAEQGGLKKGDVITEVDGRSLKGMAPEDAMALVRGREGTAVEIGWLRGGEAMRATLTRREQVIESVEGVRMADPANGIGYIRIESFSTETPGQFARALARLKAEGMDKLVLDLRLNGGGSLDAAVAVADALTDEMDKVVCHLLAFNEEAQARRDLLGAESERTLGGRDAKTADAESLFGGPLAVLVDRNSASASEVLAGCLQDWGRGFVVGEVTFGKSFVQLPIKLRTHPDYTLKVTVATYVTPMGNWLRPRSGNETGGIVPDVQVGLAEAERAAVYRGFRELPGGQEEDPAGVRDAQMEAAVSYLLGRPVAVRLVE